MKVCIEPICGDFSLARVNTLSDEIVVEIDKEHDSVDMYVYPNPEYIVGKLSDITFDDNFNIHAELTLLHSELNVFYDKEFDLLPVYVGTIYENESIYDEENNYIRKFKDIMLVKVKICLKDDNNVE